MTELTKVYRCFDSEGRLLYIGISRDVPTRMIVHKGKSEWFPLCTTITEEEFKSRREAEDAERAAILAEKPLHNSLRLKACGPRWQDYMNEKEREDYAVWSVKQKEAADAFRALDRKLKNRAYARMARKSWRESRA